MLFAVAGLIALLLTSCASGSRRSWALAEHQDITITPGPDRRQLVYEVRSAQSDQLLGKAQSQVTNWTEKSVTIEATPGRDIAFAPDNSTISIVDDFSDSYSAKRYILFTRTPDGKYTTSYLRPSPVRVPLDPNPQYPEVRSLTATTITFQAFKQPPYTVPIAKIPAFAFPQDAQ